jgi:hypothetical protein
MLRERLLIGSLSLERTPDFEEDFTELIVELKCLRLSCLDDDDLLLFTL